MPSPGTNVVTGINAVVNDFPSSGYVELQRDIDSTAIETSAGEGGVDRIAGNIDFTGTIMAYGYKPPSGVFPNLDFSLSFTENGTNNISCSSVKCTGLEVFVPAHDPSGHNALFYIVHFGADGVDLSIANSGGPGPSSNVTKYSSLGLATYLNAGTGYARETYCQWQHLFVKALVERKVNSDTGGVYFRPAGELDWEYTYNREVNSMGLLPTLNGIRTIIMQTNPAATGLINPGGVSNGAGSVGYWLIQYGIVDRYKTKIDHASRLPISYDITLEKSDNGMTNAWLYNPDGVSMWPIYSG